MSAVSEAVDASAGVPTEAPDKGRKAKSVGVAPKLTDLWQPGTRQGRTSKYAPDVREARRVARGRRAATAQARASSALRKLHLADYRALYAQALEMVQAEAGPLPGDEA